MLVRKRGGGGGGGGGMGSGGTGWFVLPGPSTLDPVLKIFYIESDTHNRNSRSSKVLFSPEKIL